MNFNKCLTVVLSLLSLIWIAGCAGKNQPTSATTNTDFPENYQCSRIVPNDARHLPAGACQKLGSWWHSDVPPQKWGEAATIVGMLTDPYFSFEGLRVINNFGAIPNDGIDDTAAVQAAIDDCYEHDVHCFIVAKPGTYDIEELYPDTNKKGTTFWGAGEWGLKRLPYSFFEEKYGNSALNYAAQSVMINLLSYHPRIYYRCRGPEECAPVRVIGMVIDGNAVEQRPDYASNYSQQHAHLIMTGNEYSAEVQIKLEVRDSLLKNGTADGIAVGINSNVKVDRVVCDGVFRGCVNYLTANSLAEITTLYVTSTEGLPLATAIDGEPQGSSGGTDPVTGEDLFRTVRAYWTFKDVVLAAGMDFSLRESDFDCEDNPDPMCTKTGGWLRIQDSYLLRPRLYLMLFKGHNEITNTYIRACDISAAVDRDPTNISGYGYSVVRWADDVTFKNVHLNICKPSDSEIASAFRIKPTLAKFRVYGLTLDQAHDTKVRRDLNLTFDNVTVTMEDNRKVDPRVVQTALYYYRGDAQQNQSWTIRDSYVTDDCYDDTCQGFDYGLYQWQGGILDVQNTLIEDPIFLCSYEHSTGNYAFTAVDDLYLNAGSSTAQVCSPNNGSHFYSTVAQ